MKPSNIDVIERHYAAGAKGEPAGMVADFADDVRWTEAAGTELAGTYVGSQAVIENVFAAIAYTWNDFRVEVDELHADDDVVFSLGTYRAVHGKTGEPLDARFVHVWRLTDGRIVQFEQIVDSAMFPRTR
jgi:ketosteroid isomerase-like protein